MSVSHSSFIMEKVFFLTAEHYLSSHRETGGLYSESYDNVAVLFASIPDFMDSFKDGGTDLSAGMLCLKALNEIIRNFDMVKANYSKYSRVPNKRPVSNKRPGWKFMRPGLSLRNMSSFKY